MENIFLVSGKTIGTIVLQAESAQEKRAWVSDFRRIGLLADAPLSPGANENEHAAAGEDEGRHDSLEDGGGDDLSSSSSAPTTPTAIRGTQRLPRTSTLLRSTTDESSPPSARNDDTLSRNAAAKYVEPPVPNIAISQLQDVEFDGWLRLRTAGKAKQ